MKSKKLLSVVMASSIIFCNAPMAFAEQDISTCKIQDTKVEVTKIALSEKDANISKEKAIEIARNMVKNNLNVDIDNEKYDQRIEFRENYGDQNKFYVYDVNWTSRNDKGRSVNVTVNALNGKVNSAYVYEQMNGNDQKIAVITNKEGQDLADSFMKKLFPKEFDQVKLIKNNDYYVGSSGVYSYYRVVNGIVANMDYINVDIDLINGKVRGFNYNWTDDLKVQEPQNVISKEKAEEILRKNAKLNLNYTTVRDKYGYEVEGKTVKLVYNCDFPEGDMVNANDGKLVMQNITDLTDMKKKDLNENQKNDFYSKYKPEIKLEKEINQKEAEEKIKTLIKELYGEGFNIERVNYSEGEGGYNKNEKIWAADFSKKVGELSQDGHITLDANTGMLVNLYKYNNDRKDNTNKEIKLTWEAAYDRAIEAIGKYFPQKVKELVTEQTFHDYNKISNTKALGYINYSFYFNRSVDKIGYSDNGIGVEFDGVTGELIRINSNWDKDIKFPKAENIIDSKKAENIIFDKYKPELRYVSINNGDYKNPQYATKLIYRLNNSINYYENFNLDAFTGKFVSRDGNEIDENLESFINKIKGSKNEKELTILAQQNIINTKDFEVNKEMTRIDLIKMLVNARGYKPYMLEGAQDLKFSGAAKGTEDYKYLQMAVKYDIIENKPELQFNGNDKITRLDAAKALIKFAGYDKLAKLKDIYVLNIKDIKDLDSENIGYATIAKGLDILEIKDGCLYPNSNITMDEGAHGMYMVLSDIKK